MLAAYVCVIAICAFSAVVGQAVQSMCGTDRWVWTSPAVGFACLMVLCDAMIRLPGGGLTSLLAACAVFVAAAIRVRRRVNLHGVMVSALPVACGVVVVASASFLANDSFGIPGVSVLNDFAGHLPWAEALRTGASPFSVIIPGYPLGPFALAATLGELPGLDVLAGFQGLLIATPVLIALVCLTLFAELGLVRRLLGAGLPAIAYLAVAALAEGAFKEPVESLFGLGIALGLQQISDTGEARLGAGVPIALLTAGSVANYSYPGLAWPGLIIASWLFAEAVRKRRRLTRAVLVRIAAVTGFGLAVAVVVALPEVLRFAAFQRVQVSTLDTQHGNLANALPFREVLGIWLSNDFRSFPAQTSAVQPVLSAFALTVFLFGVLRTWLRRDIGLLAFLFAAIAIAVYGRRVGDPYYAAKPLMVLSTVVAVISVRGLLPSAKSEDASGASPKHTSGESRHPSAPWFPPVLGWAGRELAIARRLPRQISVLVLATFATACLFSDGLALAGSFVGPEGHARELARLRPLLRRHSVLFLAEDDFSAWELRGARLSYVALYDIRDQIPFRYRPEKPPAVDQPVDFDSIAPRSLDRFDYVVTTRTGYASTPPANWSLVAATASYEVWRRHGLTRAHSILAEGGAPGALLDCATALGHALSHTAGKALVRTAPVTSAGWDVVPAGRPLVRRVYVPAGRWQLSLQYVSATAFRVSAASLHDTMPASLEHPGPYWGVGALTSPGAPITVKVSYQPPPLTLMHRPEVGTIALVRLDHHTRLVPLRSACGQYVDWYQRDRSRGRRKP